MVQFLKIPAIKIRLMKKYNVLLGFLVFLKIILLVFVDFYVVVAVVVVQLLSLSESLRPHGLGPARLHWFL